MKKTKPTRRQRGMASPPMLVMRGLCNDKIETRERIAVESFAFGFASTDHFDVIADMQGVMLLAGSTSDNRAPALHYTKDVLGPVLANIRERFNRTGKMGCNGDELKVLRGFVTKYREFWLRQPTSLYEAACTQLQIVYDEMAKANSQIKEAA